jgi:hypothetical protein
MKEYMYLGSAPANEECAQVGEDNYWQRANKECRLYISMLWSLVEKQFGSRDSIPESFNIVIKSEPHDFGSYIEVCAKFDMNDEKAVEIAFWIENNTPTEWDNESKIKLRE